MGERESGREGGGRQYEELECHILSVAIYIHVS